MNIYYTKEKTYYSLDIYEEKRGGTDENNYTYPNKWPNKYAL